MTKKEGLRIKAIDKIGVSYLVASLGFSLVLTIWAIYLESFLHNASSVGFLTTLFTLVGVLAFFLLVPLIERSSKSKLLFISLIVYVVSYFLFSIYSNIYLVIFLGILISVAGSLRVTSFGIIVRDKSKNTSVSKNVGLIYTFSNLAWLVAPLIAGYLSQQYGFKIVFFLAAMIILISTLLFKFFKIKDNRKAKKIDYNFLKISTGFFRKKERLIAYIISGAVNFWWVLIYVYIPVKIVESGLSDFLVGIFLAAVIVPLVLLEYVFGKMAGKKGFKKLFFTGYLILAILAGLCFFIENLYTVLVILSLASIGIAMVESTTESYFFDIITTSQRDKYYGPYNTAVDAGHFLGLLPSAIILLFLPFKFLFLFFAIVMLLISFLSLSIKEAFEYRRH